MKIISWNVNGIRAGYRKGFMEFVDSQSPDILCLQETKAHKEQLTEEQINPCGLNSYWSSCRIKKGYSGVATFTKKEVKYVEDGIGVKQYDDEGRFIITDHDAFTLFNIYFPNGMRNKERHDFKQEFLSTLGEHLKERIDNGESIIVVGDYNVAPGELDVYDPVKLSTVSGFLPEEREWFKEFYNIGFVDTFRHFNPNAENKFSYWNQMTRARDRNAGWRIDHICVTQNLLGRVKKAEVWDHIEGSDHCPVMIEIE